MLKIALCDDEKEWCEITAALLNEYFSKRAATPAKINIFSSGDELIDEVEDYGGFDLYIMDIAMPGMNGINVGMQLRNLESNGIIIYLTTSKEYAVDSYLTNAFYYLIKPVEKEKLYEVLDKAVGNLLNQRSKSISVKTKNSTQRLLLDNIYYVELVSKALCFHMRDGSTVTSVSQRVSFSEAVIPLLEDNRFSQCGASFVINLFYVKSIEKDSLVFSDDKRLTIPKNASATLRAKWLDYWFEGGEKS